MSTPPDHEDPDLNPGSYGFSEPAPPKREAPPVKHDKFANRQPDEDEEEDEPKPKKRRRDLAYDPQPEPEVIERPMPWWFWTAVLSVIGVLGLVAGAVKMGMGGGVKAGAIALVVAVFGVAIETVVVAALLVFVGLAFGIDYGPVKQAVVKLFGCVAFVNGFTIGFGLFCYSCMGLIGILTAMASITLVTFAVFQAQFRLSMYEALITVFAIQGSAWVMITGLGFALMGRKL